MSRPRWSKLLFGGVFIVGALVGLGLGVPGVVGALSDEALIPVRGRVLEVSTKRQALLVRGASPNSPTHQTQIRLSYAYSFDGVEHTNDVYAFDEPREGITDLGETNARVAALRSAEEIQVLVDPDDPSRAALQKRELAPAVVVSLAGMLALLIGAGLVLRWGFTNRSPR